ncbi:hypothetical protein GQX73_g8772 [Xylaria multiplex]|uniref:Uncharacterized protein n=1 Tax=Xylaria multiplex TaxID=323545 RepID=A0A7C8MKN3_9PEZI|nr:hypothetical protein GQX73_g8772 [Xylaria multiplex]
MVHEATVNQSVRLATGGYGFLLGPDEKFKNRKKLGPSTSNAAAGCCKCFLLEACARDGQPANENLRSLSVAPFNAQIELCGQSARATLAQMYPLSPFRPDWS